MLMLPVEGVGNGIETGAESAWVGEPTDAAPAVAALAQAVKKFPLSNAELLAAAQLLRPPQSWYEEDHSGLY
jgi:hypothetical protein